ncbi:Crp/Fnr family transcriptional regulator [Joostella sp. CR20]|uniref:Crp/Fnr family transcriptional regulator n=1 Tax=Joostella sp. CR20 TaxID=2804312 RepID=UPI00313E369F
MKEILKHRLSEFPEEIGDMFISAFKERTVKKGESLLSEGDRCEYLTFIYKGAMMCYYLKAGKRYIDEFSLDGEFITDYTSFIKQAPSDKNIITLEDSVIYTISYRDFEQLYSKNSIHLERLGRYMIEDLYMQWHEKSKSLLMDSAAERYEKLIKNRPHLPQRVPQYLIAEYLGITPESLSRVRKEKY